MKVKDILAPLIGTTYASVKDCADALDIPYQSLRYIWNKGPDEINAGNLKKICDAAGVSVDEILSAHAMARDIWICSDKEKEIILRYRAFPDCREPVERILGIDTTKKTTPQTSKPED